MGRYVTSLLLRRSGDCAIRLAVTGESAGMSTRAPFPATRLTSKNACGGAGVTPLRIRAAPRGLVRGPNGVFATTNLLARGPDGGKNGKVSPPAAGDICPPREIKCRVEPKAGFTPAVPRLVTFQAPPSVAEERGGSAAGDICPPREIKCRVEPKAGFTPAVPRHVTFQAPPSVAEERGGAAPAGPCPPP